MTFFAHIRRGSVTEQKWFEESRHMGVISKVVFSRISGTYKSGALTADEVGRLREEESVVIESVDVMPRVG